MDLTSMLAYQEIDKEMSKLESEFRQTECVREYQTAVRTINSEKEQVLKQNAAAGELVKQMEAMIAEYDALEKELREAEEAMPEVEDVAGAEFFSRNVQKLLQQLKNLSGEIAKLSTKIVELNQAHAASMAAGKTASQKRDAVKAQYNAEVEKVKPAVEELKKRLAEAAKACPPKFVDEYQRLKQSKKVPVLVPITGFNCGGCFMELSGDALAALENNPFVICPNCGRIVYKA